LVCLQPLLVTAEQSPLAAIPSCARIPRLESDPRAAVGFPRFYPVSTDSPFSSQLPDSPGPLRSSRGQQLRGLFWSTGYPCSFRPSRAPWPPSSCARHPIAQSLIPGRRPVSPHMAVPPGRFFPLTVPGLAWASPRCSRNRGTAACQVCRQPLSVTAGQSPLAAIPPAPGSQLLRFLSWPGPLTRQRPGTIPLTALRSELGLTSVVTQPRYCDVLGLHATPAGKFARQCYRVCLALGRVYDPLWAAISNNPTPRTMCLNRPGAVDA